MVLNNAGHLVIASSIRNVHTNSIHLTSAKLPLTMNHHPWLHTMRFIPDITVPTGYTSGTQSLEQKHPTASPFSPAYTTCFEKVNIKSDLHFPCRFLSLKQINQKLHSNTTTCTREFLRHSDKATVLKSTSKNYHHYSCFKNMKIHSV